MLARWRFGVAACLLIASAVANTAPDPRAEQAAAAAELLLQAVGGRAPWASLRNTINDSQQNRISDPVEVRAVISMDFTQPKFRIETTAPGLRLVRVVDGDRHWRLNRSGLIEPLPAALLQEDLDWYASHVYRTIHRIARRDPNLSLRLADDGRLEVHEAGRRLIWFRLDSRGEPYAFGALGDDIGRICGPWSFAQSGIRHPLWVSSPDGTWRANIRSLTINAALPDSIFARPASAEAASP